MEPQVHSPPTLSRARRRAAVAFVFVTVVLDMFALGVVVPVLPRLVVSLSGGSEVEGARMVGLFAAVWAAMQFVFSPVHGALADRFGRRPVILGSNLGLGLDYVVMAMAPSLAWLFVGRTVNGITAASIGAASAYIADVTPPAERASKFGLLGAAFGLGFILGPAVGGWLGEYDLRYPFWFAGSLSLLNAAYGLFVLPESLPPERRAPFSWRKANPVGSLAFLRSKPGLAWLAATDFVGYVAHHSLPSMFVLYAGHRHGWTPRDVGMALAVTGLSSALVSAVLVRPLTARLGERRVLLLGLGAGAVGFAVYALAPTGRLMACGIPIVSLWGLAGPSMSALTTRRVEPSEQGALQGALNSLRGVTGMVGPLLFTRAFAWSVAGPPERQIPGLTFGIAAALLGTAAVMAVWSTRPPAVRADG